MKNQEKSFYLNTRQIFLIYGALPTALLSDGRRDRTRTYDTRLLNATIFLIAVTVFKENLFSFSYIYIITYFFIKIKNFLIVEA